MQNVKNFEEILWKVLPSTNASRVLVRLGRYDEAEQEGDFFFYKTFAFEANPSLSLPTSIAKMGLQRTLNYYPIGEDYTE